jgi:hypothetical protein
MSQLVAGLMISGWMILAPVGESTNPMGVGFIGLDCHVLKAQDVTGRFDCLV